MVVHIYNMMVLQIHNIKIVLIYDIMVKETSQTSVLVEVKNNINIKHITDTHE